MAISDTNKYFKQCRTSICASHRSIAFPVCPHFSVTGGQPGEVCIVTLCVHVSAGVRSAHPVNRLDFHDLWKNMDKQMAEPTHAAHVRSHIGSTRPDLTLKTCDSTY